MFIYVPSIRNQYLPTKPLMSKRSLGVITLIVLLVTAIRSDNTPDYGNINGVEPCLFVDSQALSQTKMHRGKHEAE